MAGDEQKTQLRAITLSEFDRLRQSGYEPLDSGDASRANSDYFQIMVRRNATGNSDIRILCPTFLRGPLGFKSAGAISY